MKSARPDSHSSDRRGGEGWRGKGKIFQTWGGSLDISPPANGPRGGRTQVPGGSERPAWPRRYHDRAPETDLPPEAQRQAKEGGEATRGDV